MLTRRPFGVRCLSLQEVRNSEWALVLANATVIFLYSFRKFKSLSEALGSDCAVSI